MLLLKEAYRDDAILKLFPKPNYSHISENIKVGDAIWIDFKDIYIDDEEGNFARADGQDQSHVDDLKMSFQGGGEGCNRAGPVRSQAIKENLRSHFLV